MLKRARYLHAILNCQAENSERSGGCLDQLPPWHHRTSNTKASCVVLEVNDSRRYVKDETSKLLLYSGQALLTFRTLLVQAIPVESISAPYDHAQCFEVTKGIRTHLFFMIAPAYECTNGRHDTLRLICTTIALDD